MRPFRRTAASPLPWCWLLYARRRCEAGESARAPGAPQIRVHPAAESAECVRQISDETVRSTACGAPTPPRAFLRTSTPTPGSPAAALRQSRHTLARLLLPEKWPGRVLLVR